MASFIDLKLIAGLIISASSQMFLFSWYNPPQHSRFLVHDKKAGSIVTEKWSIKFQDDIFYWFKACCMTWSSCQMSSGTFFSWLNPPQHSGGTFSWHKGYLNSSSIKIFSWFKACCRTWSSHQVGHIFSWWNPHQHSRVLFHDKRLPASKSRISGFFSWFMAHFRSSSLCQVGSFFSLSNPQQHSWVLVRDKGKLNCYR